MSKIGVCLGGVENGKIIYCNNEFYYEYEGALKFILSKLMEAEWDEV